MPVALIAAPAAAKAAVGAVKAVTGIFAGSDPEKDKDRNRGTDEKFALAQQGDVNAALYVRQRTGRFGELVIPGYGNTGGWASDTSKDYARAKWDKIKALPNGVGAKAEALGNSIKSGIPLPPTVPTGADVAKALSTVPPMLLWIVVGALALFLILRLTRK